MLGAADTDACTTDGRLPALMEGVEVFFEKLLYFSLSKVPAISMKERTFPIWALVKLPLPTSRASDPFDPLQAASASLMMESMIC